jgi:CheY-like chemotaxis protein
LFNTVEYSEISEVADDRNDLQPGDHTVLIVEDDALFAQILLDLAHEKGFKGVVAAQGDAALTLARKYKPDAITLDIKLPDRDGWTVLDRLKHDPRTSHIPVHVITADDREYQPRKLGALTHLRKPVTREQLIEAFDRITAFAQRQVRHLLVVEDDDAQRMSIVELIGDGDVQTTAVATGAEALAQLQSREFDCLVLDLRLPDMTGFELIEKIQKELGQTNLPIIVYTGKELTEKEETQLRLVTDAIVVKEANSPERLLAETSLFLHRVEANLPEPKRRMLEQLMRRDPALTGKKVLVVDDDVRNIFALTSALESYGMEVLRAENGREGMELLEQHPDIAVILLDVHMPIIDGLETAALIRGRERTRNIPLIFLTAYDSVGSPHISRGYSLGAVDYIIKPIDPEALKSKVAVFVELFRKTEQVKQQAELLREQNIELENANLQRLSKLIALGQQLAAERDPVRLLEKFCHAARDIIGARCATVGILEDDGETLRHFLASGVDQEAAIRDGLPQASHAFLREQFAERGPLCLSRLNGSVKSLRFLPGQPHIASFLGAPILQQGQVRGWLYLADKLNAEEFSEADERFAATLTQAVVFYENARLYAETERHALALEQEIAERKLIEKERTELLARERAARAEAEAANRLKDEFLATVSHELRAPLNAMLGWVHLVRTGKLDEGSVARALEIAERSARAQKKLIDDLLDVSRIITGKLRLDIRPIELAPVIESALESVRPAAEAKGVYLQTALDPLESALMGDANRLQQVVWNLVSNAIKFTPAGGGVAVRLKRHDEQVEIAVSDTGIGIAPEFLPYVFDRFRQADSSSTRKHGGLGLGLAIVRHLVELHGGTVMAESAGEGRGATFTIHLPLTAARAKSNEEELLFMAHQQSALPNSAPMLGGLRVLVVDDEVETRELLAMMLTRCEAAVQTAGSVAEAMAILSVWPPDILISDLSMPEKDGFSLIHQVRKQEGPQSKRIPAIALTAHAGAEDRIRALAAGFQMHLAKPMEPDELVVSIASLTGRLARARAVGDEE